MKTFSLLFGIICMCVQTRAQIKITKNDMPAAGDEIIYSTTTDKVDLTKTGANVSWDFSSVKPNGNDTLHYMTSGKAGTLYLLSFYNDFAQKTQQGFDFLNASSTVYKKVGTGVKVVLDMANKFEDADEIYHFPVTYADHDSDTYYDTFSLSTYYKSIIHGKRVNTVDGWGTIKTPDSTYNCIRVKTEITEYDTNVISGFKVPLPKVNRTEYKWLANGVKMPVFQVIFNGTQTTTRYKDKYRLIPNPNGPKPAFTVTDSTIFTDDSIPFINNTTGNFLQYVWTISPSTFRYRAGTTSTSKNPNVQFEKAGKYTVSLKATSFATGSNTLTKKDYIIVTDPIAPEADFEASSTKPLTVDTVTIFDKSINSPNKWLWTITPTTFTYVGGTDNTSQNPRILFQVGTYNVALKSSNSGGNGNTSKIGYITASLTSGLDEISGSNNGFSIFPNPTNGLFQIDLINKEDKISMIEVLSLNGKSILKSNQEFVNLSSQQKGIYILKVLTEEGYFVNKISVE